MFPNGRAVLLVESNDDYAEVITQALKNTRLAETIVHVKDGATALDYLFGRGVYSDAQKNPRPHVILLDLDLPEDDGLTVLKEIRISGDLYTIPVVALAKSESEKDLAQVLQYNVCGYLRKSLDFARLTKDIVNLSSFWMSCCEDQKV